MKSLRLFIAIEFPPEMMRALNDVSQSYQRMQLQSVRWVNTKNLHLTLRFLGDTDIVRLELIKKMLVEVCSRQNSFQLAIKGVGAFPGVKNPRVIWLGIQAPADMNRFQASIENGCRSAGFTSEERPFSPHLTLGRVSESGSREDVARISKAILENQVGWVGQCSVAGLTLFKSDLTPGGSVYTPLERYLFKSP